MKTTMLHQSLLLAGGRVCITCYGPFHRLRGTILRVDDLSDPSSFDEIHCFYLVDLEGTSAKERVWFLREEIEPFTPDL